MIEWLLILCREGWLGSARRNGNEHTVAKANDAVANLRAARKAAGLHRPYGEAWERLKKKLKAPPAGPAPPGT